jgi:hypothetical protein
MITTSVLLVVPTSSTRTRHRSTVHRPRDKKLLRVVRTYIRMIPTTVLEYYVRY